MYKVIKMENKKSVQLPAENLPAHATTVDKGFYAQWERKKSVNVSSSGGKEINFAKIPHTPLSTNSNVRTIPTTRASQIKNKYLPKLSTSEEDEVERSQVIELKVMSTRAAITNCKKREMQLTEENLAMKKAIQGEERPNHEAVKTLMRRYEKFRGGISYLNDTFTTTLKSESTSLKQLEQRLENDLSYIQKEVQDLDEKLQASQNQVYVLNNYKDKEYPVKAIRIGELLTELDQVELANDDEYFDLERVINDELDKLTKEGEQAETTIKEGALNSVLDQMHPSLREMAKQNQVMATEIGYHHGQIAQLHEDIDMLRQEVKQLISHPKTNVRLQVFPELFKYEEKCTPDMEIVLDIPRVELLPI